MKLNSYIPDLKLDTDMTDTIMHNSIVIYPISVQKSIIIIIIMIIHNLYATEVLFIVNLSEIKCIF